MALTFGFYDSVNGDRTYSAKEFSRFFDGILNDGVFGDIGDAFKVTPGSGSGLNVNVGTGRAWFNRTWTYNSGDMSLAISTAEPTLNRIDTIAIIIDEPTRTNSISVIKGTPAANPVAPTLTKTAEHFEYRLSDVYIAANATSISANNITNFVGTEQTPYVNIAGSMLFFANNILPVMDGTASIGVEQSYSRADHRHPTDTSRAPVNNALLRGTPTLENTPAITDKSKAIANTEFVKNAIDNSKSSMALSGTPTAPTATAGTNNTQIATTAFVKTAIDNAIASKANLASPTFTGTPKAPTATAGTNTTQIATTAFVKTAIDNISPNTLRVYRQTTGYNGDYPILVSRSLASGIGTSGTNGSSANVYGVIWNDTSKVPTVNPSTGEMKIPGGVTGTLTGGVITDGHSIHVTDQSDITRLAIMPNTGITIRDTSGRQLRYISYESFEENIHLTEFTSRIPATADGSIAERDRVSADDTRPMSAGSLARVFGQIGARDIGTIANVVSWRLIGYTPVSAYNDVDPTIPGMIRFYYG